MLQFLLPAAGLHLHDHRSDQRRGVLLLHADRDPGLQRRGAGAHAGRSPRSAACAPPNRSTPSAASSRASATLDDVLWATAYQIALMLKVRVVLLLPENGVDRGQGRLSAGGPARRGRSRRRQLGLEQRSPGRPRLGYAAGRQAAVPADAHRARRRSASSASTTTRPGPLLTPDQRRLLDALVDQGALAIERVQLVEDMDRVKRTVETERLRSRAADLDLARPQDAAGLRARRGQHAARSRRRPDEAEKAELLATVIDESERLNRFIANLLDMTKLESGAVVPNTALHDLGEIVGSALRRAGKILGAAQGVAGARRRPADAGARCGAVRAGAVQSARQCREICAGRHHDLDPRPARSGLGLAAGHG